MRSMLVALVAAAAVALTAVGHDARAGDRPRDHEVIAQGAPAAAPAISSEVIILHATSGAGGIDPRIGNIPALTKAPFSAYGSIKLLDRSNSALTKGKSATVKLPTGSELVVTYKDVLEPKKKDDPRRFVVTSSIQKPGGNTVLPLLEVNAKAGEWFFVAGQDYKGGILVIGMRVTQ